MKSVYTLGLVWFAAVMMFAQNNPAPQGDLLLHYLGKSAESAELKELKAAYRCQMANNAHYLSKEGIQLILRNNVLAEIHFYKGSAVYGDYKNALPGHVQFGMLASEVRKILGKPLVSYNNGYSEYDFNGYNLTLWFDAGRLSQVTLSLNNSLVMK